MRTTLDIDDDLLAAARERAGRERRTMGAVVSTLLRRALNSPERGAEDPSTDEREGASFYGFAPFPRRGGLVTNELVEQLRSDDVS